MNDLVRTDRPPVDPNGLPPIDHTVPLDPGAIVRRSRLARALWVPRLFDEAGRLHRIVSVYQGTFEGLRGRLEPLGLTWTHADRPGAEWPVLEAEGVSFYPAGPVVLCGAWEDVQETLETPGRLDWLLGKLGLSRGGLRGGVARAALEAPVAAPAPDGDPDNV